MPTAPVNKAAVYGDFAGLEKLKSGAARSDPTAVRQVAQQFESLFARMMIKSMRAAIGRDPIFGSDQAQTYQSMFDDQLSLELTKGKGLGLADMLVRQLQQSSRATGQAPASGTASPKPSASASAAPAATGTASGSASRATSASSATAGTADASHATATERASFISQVWPDAQQAAQQLGVHPVSLVAQAALETNWGKNVPRSASGASSHNLFGIKAGGGWGGASVSAATQEFAGGARQQTSAAFRAYASPGESFQDYVALLKGSPRLSAALGSGPSVQSFAAALQQGGYATDPDYAHKVTSVAGQVLATLASVAAAPGSAALKIAAALPIPAGLGTLRGRS